MNATGNTSTTAASGGIGTISGNNTSLTSFELNTAANSNQLLISNAGSLGPAGSIVKLTKGIAGLSAVNGTTYNPWPTQFGGGILRLRIAGLSTYSGNGTLTANTEFAAIAGSHLAYSGTIALGGNNLALAPGTATGAITIQGVISGTGSLTTKNSASANTDGLGTSTLTAANTYSGVTTVSNGTLALTGSGSVNSSSGITVNGSSSKLLQNSSVPIAAPVTLTQGTVTGIGTINTLNVSAGTGCIISNNNGVAGAALNIGTLNLAGAANINLVSNSTSADLVVGTITNDSAAGQVTIAASNPTGWINGSTYNLINYTMIGGTGGNNFAQVVNGLSARQSATWSDTGSAIRITISGEKPYWVGDTDNKWNTTTPNNWKLLAGGYTTFLVSDDVVFNDNASGTGPISIDIDLADVSTNLLTFDNTRNYTIDSTGGFWIQAGGLTKSGSGSLTLNTANKYTGGTTLNAGTLNLGNATALGASGNLIINGGTIDNTSGSAITTPSYVRTFNGDFTFTGSSDLNLGTGATTLGTAAGTIRTITTSAGTLTLGGVISDGSTATGITKSGSGTLVLSGVSLFSGPTTVTAGTLKLGASGTSAGNGALGSNAAGTTVQSGATLDFDGKSTYVESITVSGTGVGGSGALINTGADQLNAVQHVTLAADATFGGTGRWDLRQNTTTPTLDMGGFALTKVGLNRISLAGTAVSNPGSIDVTQGVFGIQTSTVMGGDSTKSITVRNGATLCSAQSANPVSWSLNLENNSTLQAESSTTSTQNIWSGPVALSPGTVTVKADGVMSMSGIISGAGSALTKAGANVLFLSNANTYDGAPTITLGSIVAQNASALGTGSTVAVASGGRLELENLSITGKSITISGDGTNFFGALQGRSGSSTWSGNVTGATNSTRIGAAPGATLEVSGVIDSGVNLCNVIFRPANASSTVIVSGANTYPGSTSILGGVVVASSLNRVVGGTPSSSFGAPTTVADGTIIMSPGAAGILRYVGSGETTDRVVDLNGTTFGATIDQSGAAGLLKFTSDFTAAGAGPKSLTLQGSTAAAGEIAGAIVDNSATNKTSLIKAGTGTWTLSGNNTYTGTTTVNAGTLSLAAAGSIATSPGITIAAGAILNTTAKSSFAMTAAQPVTFKIDSAGAGTAGRIDAAGLDITNAIVTFGITGTLDDNAYVLATYTSKTGTAFASVTPPAGYAVNYAYNGGTQIALVKSGFDSWISGFPGLADVTAGGDPDHDGMPNLLEYVLNGNPGYSDMSILPDLDASGTNFIFTFNRRNESKDDTTQTFQYTTDLGAAWTEIAIPASTSSSVTITPNTPSTGIDKVDVSIPKGANTKLFGRLKVN